MSSTRKHAGAPDEILVRVAERPTRLPAGTRLHALRARHAPAADITIVNGFPTADDAELTDGDTVVFIQRNAPPDRDELEALMMARHTPGVHAVLKKAAVGIAGLGEIGRAHV